MTQINDAEVNFESNVMHHLYSHQTQYDSVGLSNFAQILLNTVAFCGGKKHRSTMLNVSV